MFKEKELSYKDLLLDPNNPRFSKHSDEETPKDLIDTEKEQEFAYNEMKKPSNGFDISDLATSIKADGFLPVDKIFVTKLDRGNKYLVIEGNRRLTAIKYLIKKHNTGQVAYRLSGEQLSSFEKIPCAEVATTDEDLIQRILGLRHQGSIKQWKPLPASYNLFVRYMKTYARSMGCDPKDHTEFQYVPSIASEVAAASSVKLSEFRNKIRTYRAYLQLRNIASDPENIENDDNYSKIYDTIKDNTLRSFFEFNDTNAEFSEEGAEKFLDLCTADGEREAVIKAAAAGSSNLRDFKFVIATKDDNFIDRIVNEREPASNVKADILSSQNKKNISDNLKDALGSLEKIDLGDIPEGLADGQKEIVKKIEAKLSQLLRAANE